MIYISILLIAIIISGYMMAHIITKRRYAAIFEKTQQEKQFLYSITLYADGEFSGLGFAACQYTIHTWMILNGLKIHLDAHHSTQAAQMRRYSLLRQGETKRLVENNIPAVNGTCLKAAYIIFQLIVLARNTDKEDLMQTFTNLHPNKDSAVLEMLRALIMHQGFDGFVARIRPLYENEMILSSLKTIKQQDKAEAESKLKAASDAAAKALEKILGAIVQNADSYHNVLDNPYVDDLMIVCDHNLYRMCQTMQPYIEAENHNS